MFIYVGVSLGLGFLALAAFVILQWLNIPTGSLVDWLIGIASFYWLLAIVTIPWNVYFDAQEVIVEANISREKGIFVEEKQVKYVQKVARLSIIIAIALHLVSAIVLYTLAVWGISAVGYVSSGATLLLTLLRPAIRGYQYLAVRLANIRQQIKYPREDIIELRQRFYQLEIAVKKLQQQLDLKNPKSLMAKQHQQWQETEQKLSQTQAHLVSLETINANEHQRLSQEAESAIARLTEDSQFLSHVREIIRFIKKV